MTREEALTRLEEIYARLPTVECQGYCWNTCGGIDMSPLERERIEERGVRLPEDVREWERQWLANLPVHCPALDRDTRRCTVYEVRPFVCRAWGVGRGELACPYGCRVSGRRLRFSEVLKLQRDVAAVGGAFSMLTGDVEQDAWVDFVDHPRVVPLLARWALGKVTGCE